MCLCNEQFDRPFSFKSNNLFCDYLNDIHAVLKQGISEKA